MTRVLLLCWLLSGAVWADVVVKGSLIDGTSGGQGTADLVQLIMLGQGMQPIVSLNEVSGAFELSYGGPPLPEDVSLMVQATKGRTIYSQVVTSLEIPLEITVFDAADDVSVSAVVGSLAIYAYDGSVDLGIFYNVDNQTSPPKTLEREGTFRMPLLQGATAVEISSRRNRMPLQQQFRRETGQAVIDYPIRPGRTQIVMRSVHNYENNKVNQIELPLLPAQQFMHLLVLPKELQLEGEGIVFVDRDEKENVSLYEWERVDENQSSLILKISGQSENRAQGGDRAQSDNRNGNPQGERKFQSLPNSTDGYRWYLVAGMVVVLLALTPLGLRR